MNFLSVEYVKMGTGDACADEWCIGKKKKRPEQLINLVIGGCAYCYPLVHATCEAGPIQCIE